MSNITPRAQKRQRVDEEAVEVKPNASSWDKEIIRHHDLWFEDGNIVIIAAIEDDDLTAFRLHRGVLSRHSDVFCNLFKIPQPDDVEKVEDCPVVRLQDHPSQLIHFLSALYDGHNNPFFNRDFPVQLGAVVAMLQLGTKYEVDHIKEEAIYRLKLCFPSSYKNFDIDLLKKSRQPPIKDLVHCDAIRILNLARTFELDSILPGVLYTCCQLTNQHLAVGTHDEDGIIGRLSEIDMEIVLDGRDRLRKANTKAASILFSVGPSCKGPCTEKTFRHLILNAAEDGILTSHDPLRPISSWLSRQIKEEDICRICAAHIDRLWRAGRQGIWDKLMDECFNGTPT